MEAPSILIEGDGWSEEGASDFISQIDDLLHFSDADDAGRTDEASDGSWVSTATTGMCSELMSVAGADRTDSSGFCFPSEEDVAQLEWLSVFIEDSCRPSSEISPASILPSNPKPGRLLVSSPTSVLEPRIPTSPKFCVRPRTRRSRRPAATIPWTCPPIVFQKSSECSSVKPKRKWLESGRKCTHCAIEKTPQWRTGPLGPKTLCNACGVRYKSGRLLPEYRPAASPTFMPWKHSNSHRKVIEMRTKKGRVGEGGAADAREDDGGAGR